MLIKYRHYLVQVVEKQICRNMKIVTSQAFDREYKQAADCNAAQTDM
ncbi:MAG TPA: hypothetical protein PKM17_10915 [Syntrophorhabdus sp.]|jgi:hypothetical protein|nr:hypothetical protein [Syntrophorhabdus sp.]HNY71738.1 hypothetical protein [Syntrophorhabdus sp.]HQH83904.1 hypothetical protein [Syntrophorhabdus sp.]